MESLTTSVMDSEAIVTSFSQSVISELDQLYDIWNGYEAQIQKNVQAGEELELKIKQLQFPPTVSFIVEDSDTEDPSMENIEPQVEPLSRGEFSDSSSGEDNPPLPECQRLCDCDRHPVYYDSFAPSFGDNPVSGQIDGVYIGQRVEPGDFPGHTFWIRQGDRSYVRPDPSDVYAFEQQYTPLWSDPSYPYEE